VQPIGAHDGVEGPRRRPLETDLDVLVTVGQRRDGVAQDVLDLVATGPVHDPGEIAPQDLDMIVGDAGREPLHVGVDRSLARANQRNGVRPGPGVPNGRTEIHPPDDAHRRPEQVNGMPSHPKPEVIGAFNHGRLEAPAP
jgi:hypothetical protein